MSTSERTHACVLVSHGTCLDASTDGMYLASFDPEYADGIGYAHWTHDIAQAMVFPSVVEAIQFWRTQSVTRPLRDDGQPNRPLTAHTVEPKLV